MIQFQIELVVHKILSPLDIIISLKVRSGAEAVTKHTCADQNNWLGNSSYPKFTVIDTPGFGDNIV